MREKEGRGGGPLSVGRLGSTIVKTGGEDNDDAESDTETVMYVTWAQSRKLRVTCLRWTTGRKSNVGTKLFFTCDTGWRWPICSRTNLC